MPVFRQNARVGQKVGQKEPTPSVPNVPKGTDPAKKNRPLLSLKDRPSHVGPTLCDTLPRLGQ